MRRRFLSSLAVLALLAMPCAGRTAPSGIPAKPQKTLTIGYVELAGDARYASPPDSTVTLTPPARPFAAAQMAVDEASFLSRVLGIGFVLKRESARDIDALAQAVAAWPAQHVQFVIADLPARDLLTLSDRLADQPVLLFNATAADDALRGADCRANLVHTMPSAAMKADALVQFLVARHWRDILVLRGAAPQDQTDAATMARAARKFGARLVDVKTFQLTHDPRERDQSNVALMTADSDYDVVDVIDHEGEFARYVPFATKAPRPVVGAAGLHAVGWHWAWDEHGAIQLNDRFRRAAHRPMSETDWAAWAAVKAIEQAALRTRSVAFPAMRDYLLGSNLKLDGYKGNPMSFRAWDHQLRQPLLLATANAVIARAPLPGFLHRTDALDTLGVDAPETACTLRPSPRPRP